MNYRYASAKKDFTFRSDSPLSNEAMAHYAPSVIADQAHESRGERYTFIPTIKVIEGLRKEGFEPYEVRQTKTRDVGKREHTRHMVRMRHRDLIGTLSEVPEIILLNSHDGTSSYQLLAGYFRFVCSNGLIAGSVSTDVRVRHSGDVVDSVIEGSYEVVSNLEALDVRKEQYKAITLAPTEQLLLAEAASQLKWEDKAPVSPIQLLRPRRSSDYGNDLFTVYNRVQENLIQGGLRGRATTGRRTTTRAVGGVNENVKLNRSLWELTERMAQIKLAAA